MYIENSGHGVVDTMLVNSNGVRMSAEEAERSCAVCQGLLIGTSAELVLVSSLDATSGSRLRKIY